MKIKNISQGPRGVNAVAGPVLIEPGQTVDADLTEAEAGVSKATGWFEFSEAKAKAETSAPYKTTPAT